MKNLMDCCERYLCEQSESAYALLYDVLYKEDYQYLIQQSNELFVLQFMASIWKTENKIYQKSTIFVKATTISESLVRFQKVKFALRRIEQGLDKAICLEGIAYLVEEKFSMLAVAATLKKEVRRSYQTLLMTAAYLEKYGQVSLRDQLLEFGLQMEYAPFEKEQIIGIFDGQIREQMIKKGITGDVQNDDDRKYIEKKAMTNTPLSQEALSQKDFRKFCFIVCTNDQLFLEECFLYIANLAVPFGYQVETLAVWEAESMAAGYNEGRTASDAAYKIYLHQDVLIRNPYFLYDILEIYARDEKIALIGMVGCEKLPEDGIMWHSKRVGALYGTIEVDMENTENPIFPVQKPLCEVEAIDGLLIVSCKDILFREDLFDGWDFYDVSICKEAQKLGYKIVVPKQDEPWCIHDCGKANLEHYEKYRKIFLQAYER